MAKKNRDKQVWFIPKRANVHQMLSFLHCIIERKYDGTTWNTSKQDNLNLDLKKLGATRTGNKIAPQGMRTLLASVHYLGFVYLDTTTTPSTLKVTKAGYDFYYKHNNELVPIKKLTSGLTIDESESVFFQMSKLQITNPIILAHCEDIFVFPFRVVIHMLKYLKYLDMEEIAIFVFQTKTMSEIEYKITEIKNFRSLKLEYRKELVEAYKKTEIGNITLAKAPSAGYFMAFCVGTGIMERVRIITNGGNDVGAIVVKESMQERANNLLKFHESTEAFDFQNNLNLWINYFGNPDRQTPPSLLTIKNSLDSEIYIEITDKDKILIDTSVINTKDQYFLPIFEKENYELNTYNIHDGVVIASNKFISEKNQKIEIKQQSISNDIDFNNEIMFRSYSSLEIRSLVKEILEHSKSKTFSEKMLIKLRMLKNKIGIDKTTDKSLRGAQYEYLFYLLLSALKKALIIDDVIWNGGIGKYNLPRQSPGGKIGTPDMIFIVNEIRYVLELTTIKSKSGQYSAELSSVPDHIRLYSSEFPSSEIRGIFCAPQVHERNDSVMKTILNESNIEFTSICDSKFLEILISNSKDELSAKLEDLF